MLISKIQIIDGDKKITSHYGRSTLKKIDEQKKKKQTKFSSLYKCYEIFQAHRTLKSRKKNCPLKKLRIFFGGQVNLELQEAFGYNCLQCSMLLLLITMKFFGSFNVLTLYNWLSFLHKHCCDALYMLGLYFNNRLITENQCIFYLWCNTCCRVVYTFIFT